MYTKVLQGHFTQLTQSKNNAEAAEQKAAD